MDTREAEIAFVRIAELLSEKIFQFSPAEWQTIHRRMFADVFADNSWYFRNALVRALILTWLINMEVLFWRY